MLLQNIQDATYNLLRYSIQEDDLQACTVPFMKSEILFDDELLEDKEDQVVDDNDKQIYQRLMAIWDAD